MLITSPANERVKVIRKLQERKERAQSGLFTIEGLRIVAEALDAGAQVETLVIAPELLKSAFGQELVTAYRQKGGEVLEVSRTVFERISLKEGPQGIAAVVRQKWIELDDVSVLPGSPNSSGTWVALDSVADPGNLGTILRTHDAVGGQGIILIDQSTDPYDPSAVRGSMGALFAQKLVKATSDAFIDWKRQTGMPVIGTSDRAKVDYHACRYPDSMVLLMGSERQGLPEPLMSVCDEMVSIPMLGKSDSLNLAVATAVVLYEILQQRREKP